MTWNIVDISFYVYAFFIPYPGRTFHIYPCLHQSPYIFTPRYFIRLCFFLVFPPKSCCGYLHGFSFFGDFLCSVCVAVRIVIEACYLRKELNASFAFPQLHRANIPSIEGVQYFGSRVVISIYTSKSSRLLVCWHANCTVSLLRVHWISEKKGHFFDLDHRIII